MIRIFGVLFGFSFLCGCVTANHEAPAIDTAAISKVKRKLASEDPFVISVAEAARRYPQAPAVIMGRDLYKPDESTGNIEDSLFAKALRSEKKKTSVQDKVLRIDVDRKTHVMRVLWKKEKFTMSFNLSEISREDELITDCARNGCNWSLVSVFSFGVPGGGAYRIPKTEKLVSVDKKARVGVLLNKNSDRLVLLEEANGDRNEMNGRVGHHSLISLAARPMRRLEFPETAHVAVTGKYLAVVDPWSMAVNLAKVTDYTQSKTYGLIAGDSGGIGRASNDALLVEKDGKTYICMRGVEAEAQGLCGEIQK